MKKALSSFDNLFGGLEMLDVAATFVTNEKSIAAIERMKKVYNALVSYGFEKYIGFDLSMLNGYNYYTGIVFRGYTYGTGNAIVKGGRYDNLLSQFGKDAPSVGFAIYVDELMNALSRNKIEIDVDYSNVLVLYERENQQAAISLATKLRQAERKIELVRKSDKHTIEDYIEYAKKMRFSNIYSLIDDDELVDISVNDALKTNRKITDLM